MIDASLIANYGVLGAWTLYLLYEKRIILKDLSTLMRTLRDEMQLHNQYLSNRR